MIYFCFDDKRRSAVRPVEGFNGIDCLEVVDREEPDKAERQRKLRVYFVKPPQEPLLSALEALTPANIIVTGGERVVGIRVDEVKFESGRLNIHVTPRGDYSTYTLHLVQANSDRPLQGMDPILSAVDFSFKVECESHFDCKKECSCEPDSAPSPQIDYLAKDYAGFRQLILDRLALLAPDWSERNPADLGVTLVELLAYVGDYLSYRQDAIATEAYLGTARQRSSVRRHARLVDYVMSDGRNARVWIHLRIKDTAPSAIIRLPGIMLEQGGSWTPREVDPVPGSGATIERTRFITRVPAGVKILDGDFPRIHALHAPEVFEPMEEARLHPDHNEFAFYTWSSDQCCLPKGATKATLKGSHNNLQAGDVLILLERLGPKTGEAADANPRNRHAVRLTEVQASLTDPITTQAITEIQWGQEDALPFPLCLCGESDSGRQLKDVSIALGNIVLADHGMTRDEEPVALQRWSQDTGARSQCFCSRADGSRAAPVSTSASPLKYGPITQVPMLASTTVIDGRRRTMSFNPESSAASVFRRQTVRTVPAVALGDDRGVLWLPKGDLLSSDAFAPEFVAEIENDQRAMLRFGDDQNGMRPDENSAFTAIYRVGNGRRGNVGAGAIAHLVAGSHIPGLDGWIESVTNPMPAAGGADPETLEQVRQYAPAAFRVQQRAVTPEDYAAFAEKHPQVQKAAATIRWTGSWHTIFLSVDRFGGLPVDPEFEQDLRDFLEPYRMAGHDLEIEGPHYVPLELEMTVCIDPTYFRSDVIAALRRAFGRFFDPDNFTFGDGVHLSRIYAVAQQVSGVRYVEITRFHRQGIPGTDAIKDGILKIDQLEIARLDNDANFPDRGILTLIPRGGR